MRQFILAFFAFYSISAQAELKVFRDWLFNSDDIEAGYVYAATSNDDGHVLAKYCYLESGNCLFALLIDISCEEDSDEYVALANSDAGARVVNFRCLGAADNQLHMYAFSDFDEIEEVVLEASRIGIAFPLQSDRFKVVRFSLLGSNEAIDALTEFYQRLDSEIRSEGTTKDTSSQFL